MYVLECCSITLQNHFEAKFCVNLNFWVVMLRLMLRMVCLQLQEAFRNGPYLNRRNLETQPAIMTAERF